MHKRFFALVLLALLSLLLVSSAFAQQAESEALELVNDDQIGALSFTLPEGWSSLEIQNGSVVIGNVNLADVAASGALPDEAVLMEVRIFAVNLLPEVPEEVTPRSIMEAIPNILDDGGEIEELVSGDVDYVRLDLSSEDGESVVYVRLLTPRTFALILTGGAAPGNLAGSLPTFEAILGTIAFNIETGILELDLERYAELPQGFTEQGFPQLGDPEAPVTLYEISSFDCSACGTFHDTNVDAILARVAEGKVSFVYVPIFGTGGIPSGEQATRASLCAAAQGAFWTYHDAIFSWQSFGGSAFLDERIFKGAEDLSLDMAAFEACYSGAEGEEVDAVINAAFEFARSIPSFRGTPTLIFDGNEVNWSPADGEVLGVLLDSLAEQFGN